jgi:hypothetical protein
MTEFHPTSRQPMVPGTTAYIQVTSENDARAVWWQQQQQEAERQAAQQQPPDPAYDQQLYPWREPPRSAPVTAQPQAQTRRWRFNPRWVAWIAAGFALIWTLGVVIDAVGGHADPADPAKYAIGAAVLAAVFFLIPRRPRKGS